MIYVSLITFIPTRYKVLVDKDEDYFFTFKNIKILIETDGTV